MITADRERALLSRPKASTPFNSANYRIPTSVALVTLILAQTSLGLVSVSLLVSDMPLIDIDAEINTIAAGKPQAQPKRPGLSAAALSYLSGIGIDKPSQEKPCPPPSAKHGDPAGEERLLLTLSDISTPTRTPRPPVQTSAQMPLSGSDEPPAKIDSARAMSLSSDSQGPVVALHSLSSLDFVSEAESIEVVHALSDAGEAEEVPSAVDSQPATNEEYEDDFTQTVTSSSSASSMSESTTPVKPTKPASTISSKSSASSAGSIRSTTLSRSSASSAITMVNRGTQTIPMVEPRRSMPLLIQPLPSSLRLLSLDFASAARELGEPIQSCLAKSMKEQLEVIQDSAQEHQEWLREILQSMDEVEIPRAALTSEELLGRFADIDEAE